MARSSWLCNPAGLLVSSLALASLWVTSACKQRREDMLRANTLMPAAYWSPAHAIQTHSIREHFIKKEHDSNGNPYESLDIKRKCNAKSSIALFLNSSTRISQRNHHLLETRSWSRRIK